MPARVHALLDYALGLVLIVLPWLVGIAYGGAETWALVGAGALLMVNRVLARGPMALKPTLPFTVHRLVDGLVGVVLVASPWLLGFAAATNDGLAPGVWLPHVLAGMGVVLLATFSRAPLPKQVPVPEVTPPPPPPPSRPRPRSSARSGGERGCPRTPDSTRFDAHHPPRLSPPERRREHSRRAPPGRARP